MKITQRKIRLSHQITDYFCGPAVIVTVLGAHSIHATQRGVARLAGTTKKVGTSPTGIVSTLRHFGIRVSARERRTLGDIRRALRGGMRIIVCYTEPRSNWAHYAVVTGFRGNKILLLSPDERGYEPVTMSLEEFQKRWKEDLLHTTRWAAFISQASKRRV